MTAEAARTVAAAFISRLSDYCNLLLYGLPGTLLRKLQTMHNSTAGLITGTQGHGHITPALCELHWLPIRECAKFKVTCLVCQSLFGQAPLYLADDCCLVSDSTRHSLLCCQLTFWLVWCCEHSAVTATELLQPLDLACGTLSVQLRNPDITYELFRRRLKGHLFQETWTRRSVTSDMWHLRKTLT